MPQARHGHRRFRQSLLCCALAGCMVAAAPAVLAQSTSATLRGKVLTDSNPAAEAQVTATNTATGLTRTVQASNGNYNLAGLPPGTYKIDFVADGQASSETVTLAIGQTATLNLTAGGVAAAVPPGGEATDLDTVTVVAPPALVETKTSEVATYVTQKQIETLPQGSRNFLAFADIVPGVEFKTGGEGSTSLRSGAQLSNGTNVYVDGVGQKDFVLKGGVTGQDSSRGNPFPQLGIAEYKVITSNYKAEYDQLSSAAITAVTKSGTNEFQGDFFFDYTNDSLRARSPQEAENGDEPKFKESQYGASFSGPIVLDKLHFFLAHEVKEFNQPRNITPGRNLTRAELPAQFQSAAADTVSSPFQESLTFGKLSWTPGDAHLVELTGKFRSEDELTGLGGINTIEYGTEKAGKETRLDLRYQYSAQDWLNDAHITYEDVTFGPRPATIAPGYKLGLIRESDEGLPFPGMDDVLNLGGGRDFQEKGQKGYSLQNDFTWYGWTGHTLKAGVKYKAIDISAFQQNPYNPQYYYDIDGDLVTPWRVDFGGVGASSISSVETDAKQYGVYVQDDWEVNDHLTLNLGVRWDYETNPAYEDHVTPAALAAALRADPGINGPNVDYDIENYISNGGNRDAFKDAWQPRLGFSYDINADQKHVVFGGAGRAYSRNQFDYLARELYGLAFQSYTYYFDVPGHDCTEAQPGNCLEYDPRYLDVANLQALAAQNPSAGTTVYLLNNDIKTPYSDQFSLGMRNAFSMLGHDWNSSVTLLHVLSHDGIVYAVGNRLADGSFWEPGRTFGNPPPANLEGNKRVLIGDNGVETRLNSVLLSLEKPYTNDSGWGLTAAYTYSDAKENRNNSDTFTFDYPNLDDVAFTEALGVAKHRFVASGTVDGPWGITFSGKLTLASPIWRESLNCLDGPTLCYFQPYRADTTIGYKQFDIAAQKNWQVDGVRFFVRGDLINAFNWKNWDNYDSGRGSLADGPNENFRHRTGLGISGPTRYLKVSAGFNW